MNDPKKLEVEPLGEGRWSRIERSLFERVEAGEAASPSPRAAEAVAPRWPMAAALVIAGALAAIGGAAGWRAWEAPAAGLSSSQLATSSTGSHVRVGEATLDIGPESVVSVAGDDEHGIVVHLDRGRVECEVPPRNGRPPFAVEAGDVVVRVVGTHFAVTRSSADVDVHVDHGVVGVTRGGGDRIDVHSGESWSEVATGAGGISSSTPVAPSSAPGPASSVVSTPAATAATATGPSPREIYESASSLEASNPDAAIGLYRSLAAKGGPWGMNALYAEGRLEADRGRKDESRRVLEDYLARYPSGPNAEDSRQLLESLR